MVREGSASATLRFTQTTPVTSSEFTLADVNGGTEIQMRLPPAVPPMITGTKAGQMTTSEAPVDPFSHVTISDANNGGTNTDTLTITLSGGGGVLSGSGLSGSGGSYSLTGNGGGDHERTRRARVHADRRGARDEFDDEVHVERREQRGRD